MERPERRSSTFPEAAAPRGRAWLWPPPWMHPQMRLPRKHRVRALRAVHGFPQLNVRKPLSLIQKLRPDSATRGLLRGPLNYCKFREKAQQLKLVKSQPPTADSAAQGRSFLPGTHLGVDYIRGPLREKGVVGWVGGWVIPRWVPGKKLRHSTAATTG